MLNEYGKVPLISQAEFVRRFVHYMVDAAHEDADGGLRVSVQEYAEETARLYWEDYGEDQYAPEELAAVDMSYWG